MPDENNNRHRILDGMRKAVHDKLAPKQRDLPKTTKGKAGALLREEMKRSTETDPKKREAAAKKSLAARLGVKVDSVYRYLSGKRKNPPKEIAEKLDKEVRDSAKPGLKKKVVAESRGKSIRIQSRAKFGYGTSATPGVTTTPDARWRNIAETLPASYATPLWDALEHGDDARAQEILQSYLQNEYINEGGKHGNVEVKLEDLDYMDFTIG
ncbi:telomere-protecting terminal protein Tpg [Streptomyces sp. NPDC051546]|uniref:telomere-protecting terminal protein Tpg n=1 Tax=Streptomyces sp. NPDC051546 TaxID=3365655 RepID=UPI00378CE430